MQSDKDLNSEAMLLPAQEKILLELSVDEALHATFRKSIGWQKKFGGMANPEEREGEFNVILELTLKRCSGYVITGKQSGEGSVLLAKLELEGKITETDERQRMIQFFTVTFHRMVDLYYKWGTRPPIGIPGKRSISKAGHGVGEETAKELLTLRWSVVQLKMRENEPLFDFAFQCHGEGKKDHFKRSVARVVYPYSRRDACPLWCAFYSDRQRLEDEVLEATVYPQDDVLTTRIVPSYQEGK